MAADLRAVTERCGAHAQELLAAADRQFQQRDCIGATANALEAERYDPEMRAAARAVARRCGQVIARAARLNALSLSLAGTHSEAVGVIEKAAEAIAVIESAAAVVGDVSIAESLRHEGRTRRALMDDRNLRDADLVFVPEVVDKTPGFCIQKRLVTNSEYRRFVIEGGYEDAAYWADGWKNRGTYVDTTGKPGPRGWRDGAYRGDARLNEPVTGITCEEARAYARWLSARTSRRFRLPTEREWEIAAGYDPKTGRVRKYLWGDEFDRSELTLGELSLSESESGTKHPSSLGLSDVCGRVRQWVCPRTTDSRSTDRNSVIGTKGSDFAATEEEAKALAVISNTERRSVRDFNIMHDRIGFRLVLEVGD